MVMSSVGMRCLGAPHLPSLCSGWVASQNSFREVPFAESLVC